jgi:hypothetical protein
MMQTSCLKNPSVCWRYPEDISQLFNSVVLIAAGQILGDISQRLDIAMRRFLLHSEQ